mgnify:FL=1
MERRSRDGLRRLCLYNGGMEQIILNILEALRRGETVDDKALVKLIHAERAVRVPTNAIWPSAVCCRSTSGLNVRSRLVGLRGMSIPSWNVDCCRCCV